MKPRWSDCNIKKKHDHQLFKRIRLYGKSPPDQLEAVGKMNEVQSPKTSFDIVRELNKISHEKLPSMPEKSAFMFHDTFSQSQK